MGSSSPNRVENKTYLNCHHPDMVGLLGLTPKLLNIQKILAMIFNVQLFGLTKKTGSFGRIPCRSLKYAQILVGIHTHYHVVLARSISC